MRQPETQDLPTALHCHTHPDLVNLARFSTFQALYLCRGLRIGQRTSYSNVEKAVLRSQARPEGLVGTRWTQIYPSMESVSGKGVVTNALVPGLRISGSPVGHPSHQMAGGNVGADYFSHCRRRPLQAGCLQYAMHKMGRHERRYANRFVGFPDPFAVATIGGEQTRTTSVIKKTLNPYWNESFDMSGPLPQLYWHSHG